MSTTYVAVDIGCLECGEESALVGLFTDRKAAEAALAHAEDMQQRDWHGQHGQHSFVIFEAVDPPEGERP